MDRERERGNEQYVIKMCNSKEKGGEVGRGRHEMVVEEMQDMKTSFFES